MFLRNISHFIYGNYDNTIIFSIVFMYFIILIFFTLLVIEFRAPSIVCRQLTTKLYYQSPPSTFNFSSSLIHYIQTAVPLPPFSPAPPPSSPGPHINSPSVSLKKKVKKRKKKSRPPNMALKDTIRQHNPLYHSWT